MNESSITSRVALLSIVACLLAALVSPLFAQGDGWQIPQKAASEVNPVPAGEAAIAKGKGLYRSKCQRCHGVSGKGDGPEADPDHAPGDLTDASRAVRNPDGILFYKIWNGRKKPKMPAFSTDLSREDVWTLVHYVKTLRR
jgi:mono/diheme cytochrome c family protein